MLKLLFACSLVVAAGACKKKDDAGQGSGAAPVAAVAKPAGAADTISNNDEYQSKATAAFDKMVGLFTGDGKDCDKLAADLSKFADDNVGLFAAAKTYEKAHPDDKKALDTKMEAKQKDFMEKAGPAMDACKDHKGLAAAMDKLGKMAD